jgi:DNA-binding transcriptional MerR regulator
VVYAASQKAPDAFRTISEVAEELELPQHVLRFWETRFAQIKPMKRGGGRRYYRPEDVDLLRGIRLLLYGQGFTIRGVQRLLKDKGVGFVVSVGQSGSVQTVTAADHEKPEGLPQVRQPQRREPSLDMGELHLETEEAVAQASLAPAPRTVAPLTADKRRSLEATLAELIEAKELLDQAR